LKSTLTKDELIAELARIRELADNNTTVRNALYELQIHVVDAKTIK